MHIIIQFLMESLLVNGVALVLAIGVMRVSVGGFNQLTGKNIPFQLWKDSTFWVPIVLVFLSDQHFGSVFGFFSALAVFIACLGLWALAMYSGVTRRKEIGVRKVNGASAGSIMSMLNADILKWVISAFIIGVPTVPHAQMARKFRMENRFKLVDFCFGSSVHTRYCRCCGNLAKL
ncbi:FtsX-like permease family protein [Prolixibacter sp. SD074]|uniref:ABC transporter permease n=1 Tax=Prolixibacter sp. SD074 TaxID=2652391 RepID=UPI00280BCB07|nr:FtsX-like permease family protein [Prolixibacter sp. SD074]